MKIAVGLSGGVDSSVAAKLLIEEGHDVCGVTLRLLDEQSPVAKEQSERIIEEAAQAFANVHQGKVLRGKDISAADLGL